MDTGFDAFQPPRPAVSLAGLEPRAGAPWTGGPREAIAWAASLASAAVVPGVVLDATAPACRPRELDRSARRDLAAGLRRAGLAFAGLDLFIPPEHFAQPETADRAISATAAACELAADLASLAGDAPARVVSLVLPSEAGPDVLAAIEGAAQRVGTRIADCAVPPRDTATTDAGLAVGIDPAAVLAGGLSPAKLAVQTGGALAMARVSDLAPTGRCVPGDAAGRLELGAYAATLATIGYRGFATIDLRSLPRQADAARVAIERWATAAVVPGL